MLPKLENTIGDSVDGDLSILASGENGLLWA